eukprot:211951_1
MMCVMNKNVIKETLASFQFSQNHISRAFKVYETNYGTNYNIEVLVEIVIRLQYKDIYKMQPYSCFNDEQFLSQLNIGSRLAHRYNDGVFHAAIVIAKNDSNLQIKYTHGQFKLKNETIWSDYRIEPYKFSKKLFHDSNKAYRLKTLKVGDFVDINFRLKFSGGWRSGKVYKTKWHRVQVAYSNDNNSSELTELYWVHKNNESEIADFTSKCASTLKIPYPQSKTRSSKIVFQYIRNCDKLFPYDPYIQTIPLLVSYCVLQFYYHPIIYPVLKNWKVGNKKYKIDDKIKYKDENVTTWRDVVVIDKEDNWITLQFNDTTTKCVHVIKNNNMICKP